MNDEVQQVDPQEEFKQINVGSSNPFNNKVPESEVIYAGSNLGKRISKSETGAPKNLKKHCSTTPFERHLHNQATQLREHDLVK